MRQTLYDYCHECGKTSLLEEWDQERNAPLTPETVTSGSSRYVFWRCEHGHAWRADIYSRARRDTRCPYCAGILVQRGVNDLATLAPSLVSHRKPQESLVGVSGGPCMESGGLFQSRSKIRVSGMCGKGEISPE